MRRLGALLLLCAACTSGGDDPVTPVEGSGEPVVQEGYPDGPYNSATMGGIIKPFELNGYARPAQGIGEDFRTLVKFADFYNPTGDGVYEEGSPFGAGEPKPRVLVLVMAGVWCGPCQLEAREILPDKYAALHDQGLEIVSLLADGLTAVDAGGDPATFEELDRWINQFDSAYPSVIDPSYELAAPHKGLPTNIIIDTKTMTIVLVVKSTEESFWAKVDELLAQ
jgi:hypothetical protein